MHTDILQISEAQSSLMVQLQLKHYEPQF